MRFSRILIILAMVSVVVCQGISPTAAQDFRELEATFVSEDPEGSLSFRYPVDWVVEELFPGFIMLANTQSVLDEMMADDDFEYADDEVLILFLGPSAFDSMLAGGTGFNSVNDAAVFLTESSTETTRLENTFIAGRPAVSIYDDTTPETIGYIIDFDGRYVLIFAINLNIAREHDATVRAILNTLALDADVTATTPAAPAAVAEFRETYTSPDDRTTIDLSAGWYWAVIASQRWVLIGDFPEVSALAESFESGETTQTNTVDQTWLVVMLPEALSTLVQPDAIQGGDPLSVAYNLILETIVAPRFDDAVDLRALEKRPTTLAGYPALFGESAELFLIVIDFDGSYLAIFGQFGSGAYAREDALAIINSIQYAAP